MLLLGLPQIPSVIIAERFVQVITCGYCVHHSGLRLCLRVLTSSRCTESTSRNRPRMRRYQRHKAHFRELGDIHRDGRRYVEHCSDFEGFGLSVPEPRSSPRFDDYQRVEDLSAPPQCAIALDRLLTGLSRPWTHVEFPECSLHGW